MMHRDVDTSPSLRKTKIQFGDVIKRSEYTDGVLRNNNRADNRLTNEMKMYDRAQKVILKQMGKEAQLLRNKIATTTSASPRLSHASSSEGKINPFMVHGTKSQKFDPKTINSRPAYPSLSDKYQTYVPSPRVGFNDSDGSTRRNRTKSSVTSKHTATTRRSLIKSDSPTKTIQSKIKGNSIKDESIGDDIEIQSGSALSEYRFSGIPAGSAMSQYKGDKNTVPGMVTENRSRLNHSAKSGVSFIEILKEAEEKRAKQESQMKILNGRRMQENDQEHINEQSEMRPRTPEPRSNYDDHSKQSDHLDKTLSEKQRPNKLGATPNETAFSQSK